MNPSRPDDTRVFTLEPEQRRKWDIVQAMEDLIHGLKAPDSIGISLSRDITDPVLWADGERISSIITNLAHNAIDAMPTGGNLRIDVTGDDNTIVITVRDTGTGISRENMDKVFTPFFTTKSAGEGLGLGLPTAYAAVKAHGGSITVESNAETSAGPTGTTVRIILPRGKPVIIDATRIILHDGD
jgi:signal transduction histidine kinase